VSLVTLSGAVEGPADEAVLQRLVEYSGATLGTVYGKRGKVHLRQRLPGYNAAASLSPWIVIVDLDHDADCAPELRSRWLPHPAPRMCFRVVVRALEAWLFADRERLARFLSLRVAQLPVYPDTLDDPKRLMIEMARRSSRRDIREDMAPRPGGGRSVGPAYTSRIIEFATDSWRGWRPDVAATYSNSLARSIQCLQRLIAVHAD
jgi:hypothetical protein